jgi:tetratricopeptide (TPR) repeat protein
VERVPRAFPAPFAAGLDPREAARWRGEGLALQGDFAGAARAVAWLRETGAGTAADSLDEFVGAASLDSRSASLAGEIARATAAGPEGLAELERNLELQLAAQPGDLVARFYLAVMRLQAGRLVEADSLLAEVARAGRGAPAARAYNNRGVIAASRGDWDGALAFFRSARAERPDLADSYLLEARLALDRGDTRGALAAVDSGLAAIPGDPRLLEQRAALAGPRRTGSPG